MAKIDWRNKLDWNDDVLDEVRLVAFAYIRQGHYDVAIDFFEALSTLDPDSAYDAQTLGALYVQQGNPQKALKYFDRALKLEADHGPTLLNLAKALFMLGKQQEGLKLARMLEKEKDLAISSVARALILAYE